MRDRPRVVAERQVRAGAASGAEHAGRPRARCAPAEAETLTSILADRSSTEGTGTRAAAPGPAGRRQDRDDRQLRRRVVRRLHARARGRRSGSAIPNELKPMLTEFHGEPVAGGTLPALIWKAFMGRALAGTPTTSFASPPYLPTYGARVVFRNGTVAARQRLLPGDAPSSATSPAACPPRRRRATRTRSSVPVLVGRSVDSARAALDSVPLGRRSWCTSRPSRAHDPARSCSRRRAAASCRQTALSASGSRRRRTGSCRTSSARACPRRRSAAAS